MPKIIHTMQQFAQGMLAGLILCAPLALFAFNVRVG